LCGGDGSSTSKQNDAADRLAFVHQVEGLVDVFEWHGVGDHRVDLDLLFHVPIDDPRHVGATAGAAEGGAAPDPAGDELEGAGLDFGTRGRDTDDDALAPTLVAALQRRAHEIDVAHAFKGVVGAALGEIDEVFDEVIAGFARIDKVS